MPTIPAQETSNDLYGMLPEGIRRQLTRADRRKTVPTGTHLIIHGIPPKDLVILEAGSVDMSFPTGKKIFPVTVAGAGKVFGLREVLFQALPEVDVVCGEECTIKLLPAETVRQILGSCPEACFAIAKVLSFDLQMAQSLLRRMPRRVHGRA